MKFDIIVTENFERKVKRLSRKYLSLKSDLKIIFDQLALNPTLGKSIGNNCYKIRFAISSKGQGKSGGTRIITYVLFVKETVYLIDIYDKSEKESITEKEIIEIVSLILE
jgi:mRNA-degrading endonuclease RelE of RelBE toxin-antitoxin system